MNFSKKHIYRKHRGVALILSMIFIAIFSALAVSMVSMSDTNAQLSGNHHEINNALSSAQSGIEIIRHYISNMNISSDVASQDRLSFATSSLRTTFEENEITNITANYDSNSETLTIPSVTLNSASSQSFSATVSYDGNDYDAIQIDITGNGYKFSRTIRVNYDFTTIGDSIFDYGVATKGALQMSGQTEINDVNLVDDVNLDISSNIYIDANDITGDAFSITNHASVGGDVSIANPYATFEIGSNSSVGGDTGEDAEENVHVGIDYVDFPTPDTEYFRPFATGPVIDSNTNLSDYETLDNATILPNTNPTFASDIAIRGVLFIEQPNIVHFEGQSSVTGIIVAAGDVDNESTDNGIVFSGQVVCYDVTALDGEQFEDISQETGTFIVAPGFSLDFSGQAMTLSGVIAANGISFGGQAGGTIDGTIINYSSSPMIMSGQSNLTFDRSGAEAVPAGFVPNLILTYDPESYSETHL
ncbi:pilus assembly PilX N-terminal domain-containing protein [Planctomycetota bacterium]